MPEAKKLNLRINGQPYERVRLQYELVDEHPKGPNQIVIEDPALGDFVLTNEFTIELQEEGREWHTVTLTYLTTLLQTYRD